MILLLGGTGLLGGQVVKQLREARYPVRLLALGSRDWRDSAVQDVRQKGTEFVVADATDKDAMFKASEGCTAIINMAGNMPPKMGVDLEALHVGVAENMLEVAQARGIQRLIYVSCLAAAANAPGEYLQTKYEAEQLIAKTALYWTIFRPSYVFADQFPVLDALGPLIRFRLFMPVVGSGQNRIQPVHALDVASCIVSSIYDRETVGKSFELAGSESISIQKLMERVRKEAGLGGNSMNIPTSKAAVTVDTLAKMMPRTPINTEMVNLLTVDSITDRNALIDYFKREPMPMEPLFQRYAKI